MTHAADPAITGAPAPPRKRWYRQLYVQVLVAIVIGIFVGWRWPDLGEAMQPIGTTFIAPASAARVGAHDLGPVKVSL